MAWQTRPSKSVAPVEAIEMPSSRRSRIAPFLTGFPTRYAAARGLYRIFNDAEYRFYRSNSAPPAEADSPFATSATLPATPVDTYADGTWYISMSYFNGVLDSGFLPVGPHGETYLKLEIASGLHVATRPSVPTRITLEQRPGGVVRVNAVYARVADGASAADHWAIAYTTNGSTPPSGSPSATPAMQSGPLALLAYDLPAQVGGTVVKVQLQTKRSSVFSLASTVASLTVATVGASTPLGLHSWPGALPEDL